MATLMFAVTPVNAQLLRDRILDDVRVSGHCLTISFSFPLRYLTHHPPNAGDELRVRLRPIQVASVDRDALLKRETVVPRRAESLGIEEVLYEGDIVGGPYLTVRFTKTVRYRVSEKRNFRGLVISTGAAEEDDQCGASG